MTQQAAQITLRGQTMGTDYTVKYIDPADGRALPSPAAIKAQIERRLQEINAEMSTWLPDSTISQFNQLQDERWFVLPPDFATVLLQDERWFVLPPDFATVLREAVELHAITAGGLDVSLGTLVNRWGFGPTPRAADPAASTSEARGMAQIELAEESGMWFVRKKQPQLQLDLSAIAKGYGVDALAAVLDAADISDYLVEIGGELRGRGLNPLQQPWRVGIEHPQAREQHVAIVALDDLALALHILTALPLLASAAPYQQGASATATVDAGEHVVKHDTITAAKKKDGTFDRKNPVGTSEKDFNRSGNPVRVIWYGNPKDADSKIAQTGA